MAFAPDGSTPRLCPLCNFFSTPKPEWDESPHPTYCPRDGFKLELLICPSCGAPRSMYNYNYTLGSRHAVSRHCTNCGEQLPPLEPKEPRMHEKPKKPRVRRAKKGTPLEPPHNGDSAL
jgi:hypothetical protein